MSHDNLDTSTIHSAETALRVAQLASDVAALDLLLDDSLVFTGPDYKEPRVLRYTLVRTPAGWRIHDIARAKEWSLVAVLSKKS